MPMYLMPMRSLAVVLALISCAAALNVVSIPISRREGPLLRPRSGWAKRATVLESLVNNMTVAFYAAHISVGTPPQDIVVQLDTGSSDTYLMASSANACLGGQCIGGTFDPTRSSTFKVVDKNGFDITYQDKSGSSGDYVSDNLVISTASLKAVELGLAYYTTIGYGVMGICYDSDEASRSSYPNVIDQLVTQGQINAKVYSLYLDDIKANTGSILFGGIDQAKFDGQLNVLAIQPSPDTGTIREFLVPLNSISITDQSGTTKSLSSTTINGVLDSGTYLTYLPTDLVTTLIHLFSAFDDTANSGVIFVDCGLLSSQSNAYMTFTFGSAQIRVGITELVSRIDGAPSGTPFSDPCLLGVLPAASDSPYIFGDTFLRSAYVVYDLDHNQVGIAQANFDTTASSVYEIPKGASGIPSLSGAGSAPKSATPSSAAPSSAAPSSATRSSAAPTSAAPSSAAPSSAAPSSHPSSTVASSSAIKSSTTPSSAPIGPTITAIITNTKPTTLGTFTPAVTTPSTSHPVATVSSSDAMGRTPPPPFSPILLLPVLFALLSLVW